MEATHDDAAIGDYKPDCNSSNDLNGCRRYRYCFRSANSVSCSMVKRCEKLAKIVPDLWTPYGMVGMHKRAPPSTCAFWSVSLRIICAAQSFHMVSQLAAVLPVSRGKQDDLSWSHQPHAILTILPHKFVTICCRVEWDHTSLKPC